MGAAHTHVQHRRRADRGRPARSVVGARAASRPPHVFSQLAAGLVLLGAAAVAGLVFVHRPWPNRVDAAGFALLPADPSSRVYADIAAAGSLRALLAGAAAAGLISVWRDRARAAACLVGPVLAVLVTEWVAKPLVGRHLGVLGGNSYPSGTVTVVAGVATALLLAAPGRLRLALALPAAGAVAAVCVAVVAMRWHYPTDAAGGLLVGAGSVLMVDAAVHLPSAARERRRARAAARGGDATGTHASGASADEEPPSGALPVRAPARDSSIETAIRQ